MGSAEVVGSRWQRRWSAGRFLELDFIGHHAYTQYVYQYGFVPLALGQICACEQHEAMYLDWCSWLNAFGFVPRALSLS